MTDAQPQPAVLTTESSVTCAHQGTVAAASTKRLRVGKAGVLLAPTTGATVKDCIVVDDPNTATRKCRIVSSVTAGESPRLRVGDAAVVLAVLSGLSDGAPPATGVPLPPPIAKQARLRAAVGVA
jgi:hypothetical protein